jgi:hypothetical protein
MVINITLDLHPNHPPPFPIKFITTIQLIHPSIHPSINSYEIPLNYHFCRLNPCHPSITIHLSFQALLELLRATPEDPSDPAALWRRWARRLDVVEATGGGLEVMG